jgi:hypothetical protein
MLSISQRFAARDDRGMIYVNEWRCSTSFKIFSLNCLNPCLGIS